MRILTMFKRENAKKKHEYKMLRSDTNNILFVLYFAQKRCF